MAPTRRDVMRLGGVAAAVALFPAVAVADSNGISQAIAAFTKGAMALEAGLSLEVPEIADNGGAVPVRVAAAGARRIALFTDGNPYPGVVVFEFGRFTPPAATIRIRLARSQSVIAVAELTDGTFRKASRAVAVTVGGCA